MWKLILVMVVALHFEAAGVILLSKGLKQIGEVQSYNLQEIMGLLKRGVTNGCILLGVLSLTIFFAGLLMLMSRADVSFIWPLTSLGFVITTIAAGVVLKEEVSGLRWVGVMFIMLGAGVITYSEKLKESKLHQSTTTDSVSPRSQSELHP